MTSLNDNRPLMYALLSVGLFSVALASNMLPDVSNQFEIIIFPAEFRKMFNFIFLHRKVKSNASQKYIIADRAYSFAHKSFEVTSDRWNPIGNCISFRGALDFTFFFLNVFFILNSKKRFSDSSGFIWFFRRLRNWSNFTFSVWIWITQITLDFFLLQKCFFN